MNAKRALRILFWSIVLAAAVVLSVIVFTIIDTALLATGAPAERHIDATPGA